MIALSAPHSDIQSTPQNSYTVAGQAQASSIHYTYSIRMMHKGL